MPSRECVGFSTRTHRTIFNRWQGRPDEVLNISSRRSVSYAGPCRVQLQFDSDTASYLQPFLHARWKQLHPAELPLEPSTVRRQLLDQHLGAEPFNPATRGFLRRTCRRSLQHIYEVRVLEIRLVIKRVPVHSFAILCHTLIVLLRSSDTAATSILESHHSPLPLQGS
jgi:hypothetical protein